MHVRTLFTSDKIEPGDGKEESGVKPIEEADDEDGLQNCNITSFMKPKVPTWIKEGLLEHIIEFVALKIRYV